MNILGKMALLSGFATLLAIPASALEIRPILTLDVARKIVEACINKARSKAGRCMSRCLTSAAT